MTESINIKSGKVVGIKTSIFTIFNAEKYDATAIPTAWGEFFKKAMGTDLLNTDTYYGVSIPSMSMDAPMDYFAGALMDDSFEIPSGFESVSLPGGDYLTIEHVGPISNIATSYQKAYMEVLPKSDNEMRPAPHLEIYNSQLDPMSVDYKMLIAIPIQS
jgi:predicted transcriptional regulator YdeE